MTRDERIKRTNNKIKQRENMIRIHGLQGGSTYKKHRDKIDKSTGYLRTGNLTHYAALGFNNKTRDKNRYGKKVYYSHSDQVKIDRLNYQLEDL